MKVHYINILLFAIPLNILIYNQRNHYITRTPKATTRTLCECELYTPTNYDNDPEMKAVMQDFDRQTSQRFEEYNERMMKNRQKCKDKCDKEIQKIILKDKLEKELMDKFATLHTDIQNDAIPTCVCEKSVADKVEKGCLRCTQNLGGIVAPSSGVLGGIAEGALSVWKAAELVTAKKLAAEAGAAMGKAAGDIEGAAKVIELIELKFHIKKLTIVSLDSIIDANTYTKSSLISGIIQGEYEGSGCRSIFSLPGTNKPFCTFMNGRIEATSRAVGGRGFDPTKFIETNVEEAVAKGTQAAETEAAKVTLSKTVEFEAAKKGAIETSCMGYQTTIIASIVAIVVIVLIMVIIYLILRYRRKKKMKKKLQYIKLLEE
ncbi:hypothetical protein PFBG_00008 [Plasmodium falciparum 7G8]|uniref:Rifin n=1 Tax=Plasmodium falciparum (isolate 7G8) TaxID=57266 RepID=W7FFB2_PLAF8|nr:hypothetical protein PFBG_00008 [Plasmodium falciparum 7G8]